MKKLCVSIIAFMMFHSSMRSDTSAADSVTLTLKEAIEIALRENPEIHAAKKMWEEAVNKIGVERSLPDSMIGLHQENSPTVGSEPQEKSTHIEFSQEIPFPGKIRHQGLMAHHEAEMFRQKYRAKEIEVLSEAKISYAKLILTNQRLALFRQAKELWENSYESVKSKYVTGQIPQNELLLADMEVRKLMAKEIAELQERNNALYALNTVMGQDPKTGIDKLESSPYLQKPLFKSEELYGKALQNNPEYLETGHWKDHGKSMTARARYNLLPDISLDYELEQPEMGSSGNTVGVTLRYPLWLGRPISNLKSARAHLLFTDHQQKQIRNRILKMIQTEISEVDTHYKLSKLYEESLLPLARQTLQVTQKSYLSGKTDFLKLLEAYRTFLETEMAYYEELWHYSEHWAMLEKYVGTEL